ncbi:hypothetical protein GVN20_26575 [Runella sp. CRIBMP]|uniref:glycosyltransferase n=1 Tax=Runella sp. CRIBMP TaxID=2683261 RepID=UPI001412C639|nr:hypothetical protein [Runella sp. CRIBMP]NBB22950.1 hypothetical protein [Runella sp. CRIBMP]
MKVYLDPWTDVDYTAFYIQGLYEMYGSKNVQFSSRYFNGKKPNLALKFVVENGAKISRYVIDWSDATTVEREDYEWCDVYGKINYNEKATPEELRGKIISMAPGFGIKIWSLSKSVFLAGSNCLRATPPLNQTKRFLSKYIKHNRHLPIESYRPRPSKSDYVFSVSALWNSDEWIRNDETVNLYRARFFEVCKSIKNLHFEGGFVYSQIKNRNPRFQHLMLETDWILKEEYIAKIKDSTIVFNTPAWAMCHGWKLGEYLALGKAIISTPLINDLPAPLEHGKHIHYVSGQEDEIKKAVELLLNDKQYRQHLEKGAYEYYAKYASPSQSVKLLVGEVCE